MWRSWLMGGLGLVAHVLKDSTTRLVSIGGTAYASDPLGRPVTKNGPRPVGIKLIDKIVAQRRS
jgi:hypothetical protein